MWEPLEAEEIFLAFLAARLAVENPRDRDRRWVHAVRDEKDDVSRRPFVRLHRSPRGEGLLAVLEIFVLFNRRVGPREGGKRGEDRGKGDGAA